MLAARMLEPTDPRPRRWRAAFVAHDAMKQALAGFVVRHRVQLGGWQIVATAGTAEVLRAADGLRIRVVLPGTRGGDAQIAAEMASGEIDVLILLRDPLTPRFQEPDPGALLRVADIHNVAVATNLATAECVVRALAPEADRVARRAG